MRYHEIISEGVKRVTVWSGATIPVLNNPSKGQFEQFVAKYPVLRGLLSPSGEDIWLWDATMAVHPNLIQELGLGSYDCIFYNLHHTGHWTGWGANVGDKYAPAIERLTPYVAPKSSVSDEKLLQMLRDELISGENT